jgi:hypothetical protein
MRLYHRGTTEEGGDTWRETTVAADLGGQDRDC